MELACSRIKQLRPGRCDVCLQVLVHGFVFNGRGSYLRNPWNVLDFAIVVIGELRWCEVKESMMGSRLAG